MSSKAYQTTRNCATCERNRATLSSKPHLQLLLTSRSHKAGAMDICGEMLQTKKLKSICHGDDGTMLQDNKNESYMKTDGYVCLECVPRSTDCAILYILSSLDSKRLSMQEEAFRNNKQVSGLKHLTSTAYHPQTNRQVKSYYKTIFTRLQLYVAQH